MNSKISVIIPAYNLENYIGELLDSISKQTLQPYEVIVINDGSTDNTEKVVENYEFVKAIKTQNQGVSAARNEGIKIATGDYIAFLDGDDTISDTYLEKLLEADGDVVRCSYQEFGNSDKIFNARNNIVEYKDGYIHSFDYIVWASLIKKSLIDEYSLQFVDGENYAEDAPYCMLLHSLSRNFKIVDDVLYFHRVRDNSAVSKVQTGKLKPNPPYGGMIHAIETYMNCKKDNQDKSFFEFCFLRNIASFLTTQYMFRPYDGDFRKELCRNFNNIMDKYCSNAENNTYIFGDDKEKIKNHPHVIRTATKMMVLAYSHNKLYEFSSLSSKVLRLLNRTKA